MQPHKKFKIRIRHGIYLAVLILAVILVWHFYFNNAPAKQQMPDSKPPVRDAVTVAQPVPQFLNGLGTVLPSGDVLVQSRVDGQLLKLHFTDGQRVKAGDLLAEIDPRPFLAALGQAEGNLAKDKAQLENAKRDLLRYSKLAKGDFIAEQQLETQKALVRQYEGIVEADKAAVASARLQLEYSRITAPISGRLGLRNADAGNQIKAQDANGIVRITETSPCDVIFTIPENQVGIVAKALAEREQNAEMPPLRVEAWDSRQKELLDIGELVSLDNQIDSSTGTVRLKARFPNAKFQLFPNQFVNARLLARVIPSAVTMPSAASQLGAKGSYCYVIEKENRNGKLSDVAHYREITPGISTNGVLQVEKGLKAGERVAVDGLDRLKDGISVKVAGSVETKDITSEIFKNGN